MREFVHFDRQLDPETSATPRTVETGEPLAQSTGAGEYVDYWDFIIRLHLGRRLCVTGFYEGRNSTIWRERRKIWNGIGDGIHLAFRSHFVSPHGPSHPWHVACRCRCRCRCQSWERQERSAGSDAIAS